MPPVIVRIEGFEPHAFGKRKKSLKSLLDAFSERIHTAVRRLYRLRLLALAPQNRLQGCNHFFFIPLKKFLVLHFYTDSTP